MYDYYKNIKELTEIAGIELNDIYDYHLNEDYFAIYNVYFQYCQQHLSEYSSKYNIQPALFYYRNSLSINARAGIQNSYFIVSVNMANIVELQRIFTKNKTIFVDNVELRHYNLLPSTGTATVGNLMFRVASQFTFFHEQAHLIQKKEGKSFWMTENYKDLENIDFDFKRHIIEYDADLHAVNNISYFLLLDYHNMDHFHKTKANLFRLLCLGISGILCYFFRLHDDFKTIYYKEKEHPHPMIRILYILNEFIKTVNFNLSDQFNFNQSEILGEVLHICNKMLLPSETKDSESFLRLNLNEFKTILLKESSNISRYTAELINESYSIPYLVKNSGFY